MSEPKLDPKIAEEVHHMAFLIAQANDLIEAFDDADLSNGSALALAQAQATLACAIAQRELVILLAARLPTP